MLSGDFNKTVIRDGCKQVDVYSPSQYDPLTLLGKGSQGVVCKGWDNDNNKYVSIKQVSFSDEENAKRIFREFELSKIVKHQNIITLQYAYTLCETFYGLNEMYLVYEFMDCTLLQFRKTNFELFENEKGGNFTGLILHQVLSATKYLHQEDLQLIHRDIKPENILIRKISNNFYILKIADLGLARQLPFCDKADLTKSIGTLQYRAPEICISANYGTSADLWSIGCLLYWLITRRLLFSGNDENELMCTIVETVTLKQEEFSTLCSTYKSIKAKCKNSWSTNLLDEKLKNFGTKWIASKERKTMEIVNLTELLHGFLAFDPEKRLTAERALEMPCWNYLSECYKSYKTGDKNGRVEKPYTEKFGNSGTIEDWKERLFESVKEYQEIISKKYNKHEQ